MDTGFSVLEHPSDLGIEARGVSMEESFGAAARGLMSIILDPGTVRASETRNVDIHAADKEQLLVRWLTEVLFLYDGLRFVSAECIVHECSHTHLRASLKGEPITPERHRTRLDVKAVTYHQLLVEERSDGVVVRVFLDI